MRTTPRHGTAILLVPWMLVAQPLPTSASSTSLAIPASDGTGSLTATVFDDGPEAKAPIVVLLPGGNGPQEIGFAWPHHAKYAQRLADAGFRAVVLDYHAPRRSLLASAQIDDISTALDTLANRYGSGRFSLIGFSMGGANALRVASTRRDVSGVVCYFSPVRIASLPSTIRQPLDHIRDLRCPVLAFQGGEDIVTDTSQYRLMLEGLRHEGVTHDSMFFPLARHGFTYAGAPTTERIRYDPAATEASIVRTISFLSRTSGMHGRPGPKRSPRRTRASVYTATGRCAVAVEGTGFTVLLAP